MKEFCDYRFPCGICAKYDIVCNMPTVDQAAICEYEKMKKELQFTRDFIHRHGLTFELASEWERKNKS